MKFEVRVATATDAVEVCVAPIGFIRVLNAPFYRPEHIEAWAGRKRAEGFYRHLGFKELERKLYPLRGSSSSLEAIEMRKDL